MKVLAMASLVLVLLLLALSSYLRLDHSGIGCEPWPQCYARIQVAEPESPQGVLRNTYERLAAEAEMPMSWATPWHRLVASVLGLLIVALAALSLVRRQDRLLAISLLALTVFLAWLGIYSEGLHHPGIVIGNLGGGFLMLGLVAWLIMKPRHRDATRHAATATLATAAIAALCLQILVGGLTSANFAATACPTVPDCNGSLLPGAAVIDAFDLRTPHQVSASGRVLPRGAERVEIHRLHRGTAVLTLLLVIATAVAAVKAGVTATRTGTLLAVVVLLEFAVGVAAVVAQLPIALAVAHNWLAALLLLLLLRVLADTRSDGMRNITYAG